MKNKRNYYRILYVQPDAPSEVIRASYRTLMQKLRKHPDLGGENWNASIINEAHAVLTDQTRRRAYDRELFGKSDYKTLGKQHPEQRREQRRKTDPTTVGVRSGPRWSAERGRPCWDSTPTFSLADQ